MKTGKFTHEQIALALRQAEAGTPTFASLMAHQSRRALPEHRKRPLAFQRGVATSGYRDALTATPSRTECGNTNSSCC